MGISVKPVKGLKTGGWRNKKPVVDEVKCIGCRKCEEVCPDNCATVDEKRKKAVIDYDYCKGCGICAIECPVKAIAMVEEK